MSIFEAILWGVLQGATEFLPVSSSGHLVLVPWLLGRTVPGVTYDVMAHAGTLAAALVFFWRDIWGLLVGLWQSVRTRRLMPQGRLALLIVLSAVPAGLAGALLNDIVEAAFSKPAIVAVFMLVTGALLTLGERLGRRERGLVKLTLRDAITIGLAQCISLLPGVSRSGTTISTGLLRGLDRESATRFSFLMALPVIAGAAGYQMLTLPVGELETGVGLLFFGFVSAALTGYVALKWLLRLVRRHSLMPFAYYVWALGLLCLIVAAVR